MRTKLLSVFMAVCTVLTGLETAPLRADADADRPATSRQNSKPPIVFEDDVRPILQAKCARCHGEQVRKAELKLTTIAGVRKGSVSGRIVHKGKPEESLLYEVVHKKVMPKDGKNPLTPHEVETIRRWIATGARTQAGDASAQGNRLTQEDILPVMYLRCTVCHGGDDPKADLDLRSVAGMLEGGQSGPAVVPGKPEKSLILEKVRHKEMPPPKKLVDAGVRPMEKREIEHLEKWIAAGAPVVETEPDVATTGPDPLVTEDDRDYWAFQPPERPAVPSVQHKERLRNPVDAFILRKLEQKDLSLAPEADKLTLIRRVAFDLTGLPPDWREVQRFLNDDGPGAYERMVDRFLASPAYGEHWGQYWLDLAGYADSEGKRNADRIRHHAWRYRDYVIRSFNADKPYDQFLLEQLAGDELVKHEGGWGRAGGEPPARSTGGSLRSTPATPITPEIEEKLVATGFLRMAPDGTGSQIVNTAAERMEVIRDEIDILGDAVLGLTIRCAQCHSHKYDPIPQRDYYRLMAVFKPAYGLYDWIKPERRNLPHVSEDEQQAWREQERQVDEKISNLRERLERERREAVERIVRKRIAKLSDNVQQKLTALLDTPGKERTKAQNKLASEYKDELHVDPDKAEKLDPEFKKLARKTEKEIDELKEQVPKRPAIRALWDRGVDSPTYIFRRGEVTKPGRRVGPGVPSVLTDGRGPFRSGKTATRSSKTGRRLAFARWLVQPDHPLTARVMVNRVWGHHFGEGIVRTTDNFGKTGADPTHPQLLDWLAREFVDRGWSLKQMHRLMLTSGTYRQVSQSTPERDKADPKNELLSRMPLKRMRAEVVRDSILKVAGELNPRRFGKPDPVRVRDDGLITSRELPEGGRRRSIYVRHRRKEMPTLLETFDRPGMIPNCVERPESTVASQALYLMNNRMIRELARSFAERVRSEAGEQPQRQVQRAYQLALNRPPSREERKLGIETLEKLTRKWKNHLQDEENGNDEAAVRALTNYCHTLLNSAAFLYID